MASGLFGRVFSGKRKRKQSSSSEETIFEDPEISFNFFATPTKKKAKLDIDYVVAVSPKPVEPLCQLIDEDISFLISDTAEPEEPRLSPNGYILPDPLPSGLIVTDLCEARWKIGRSVGLGGFGEVYSAALWNGSQDETEENYVIKVEPHSNGPLFVEINFYLRAAKADMIQSYKEQRNLIHLGVPEFVASGSFIYRGKKLRFLVMPRYGADLQTVLDASGNVLSKLTASSIAIQVIDSFEYLHTVGYVHKDLKGANLLFSRQGPADGKVFLVDYGLISKLSRSGLPRPNISDPRSAHEGTLEFCSRDAHRGCISRRGDLEVLLFNVIDWLGGKLAWDKEPQMKPRQIHQMKINAFANVKKFLAKTFSTQSYPAFLESLMLQIDSLKFHDIPDYNLFRSIFRPDNAIPHTSVTSLSSSAVSSEDDEVILSLNMVKSPIFEVSPEASLTVSKRKRPKRSPLLAKRKGLRRRTGDPSPEKEVSQLEVTLVSPEVEFETARCLLERARDEESLKNPTPAMLEQLEKIQKRKLIGTAFSPGRRKESLKKRGRSSAFSPGVRQRRKSSEVENLKIDNLNLLPRSPKRPAVGVVRAVAMRREVDKKSLIRKHFENAVGGFAMSQFLYRVSKTFFPFQK